MPTPDTRPQLDNRNPQRDNDNANDAAGGNQRAPVTPDAPGGGTLTNTIFSGDHVLESIAKGNGLLKQGAKGPAVRAIQRFLIAEGYDLGRTGADGDWGKRTTGAVKTWQKAHGLSSDGVIGKDSLGLMDKTTPGSSPAPSPNNQRPGANEPGGGLPSDFEAMWEAHPQNYQDDPSENYASDDLQRDQGWDPNQYSNTCAIRLSVMWNKLGGDFKLSRKKAKQAGLRPERLPYSRKTGWYYILSAKEMWQYTEYWAGKPHAEYPSRGRYKDADAFQKDFDGEIRDQITGKKGIVAFDKIFGYSGTGHVDIFDGERLSDATNWYPSRALKLWFV